MSNVWFTNVIQKCRFKRFLNFELKIHIKSDWSFLNFLHSDVFRGRCRCCYFTDSKFFLKICKFCWRTTVIIWERGWFNRGIKSLRGLCLISKRGVLWKQCSLIFFSRGFLIAFGKAFIEKPLYTFENTRESQDFGFPSWLLTRIEINQ